MNAPVIQGPRSLDDAGFLLKKIRRVPVRVLETTEPGNGGRAEKPKRLPTNCGNATLKREGAGAMSYFRVKSLAVKGLMAKLVLYFVLVALLPIVLVGYLSFRSATTSLEQLQLEKLDSLREAKADELRQYLQETADSVAFLGTTARLQRAFEHLVSREATRRGASAGQETAAPSGSEAEDRKPADAKDPMAGLVEVLDAFFAQKKATEGYEDALLIDAKLGQVLYSYKGLSDTGANLRSGVLSDSNLARLWQRIVETKQPSMVDFALYQQTGQQAAFIGVPVFGRQDKGVFCGVLALRMSSSGIIGVMKTPATAGRTAETYVVGPDLLIRSALRREDESSVMKQKVDSLSVQRALNNQAGSMKGRGYHGEPVLSSYSPMRTLEGKAASDTLKWALVAEIDESETMGPAVRMAYQIVLASVVIAVLVGVIGLLLARAVARPVMDLAAHVTGAREGDLTVEIPGLNRNDEIGNLACAFQALLASLREQIQQTLAGVDVLSSSAEEISETVAALSVSTYKTSSAVTETTTTVEEVRQAAKSSSEKAKQVADEARHAVQISEEGKKATDETVSRMNIIKGQMTSIGETVVKLSEHTQSIERIIGTVQDIADQSNLLAVNASIEAARAGDQGKGFAVVAHEIKDMADQSKAATEQVRALLGDTQKWVSAVVAATEQGGKAVEAGVQQSFLTGESIKSLMQAVATSAQIAAVIQGSSEQQALGVGQVSVAMQRIGEALEQNVGGTTQLEDAAGRLSDLGDQLKLLVRKYKV
jgi:methyl-accepting chemotaxis protein